MLLPKFSYGEWLYEGVAYSSNTKNLATYPHAAALIYNKAFTTPIHTSLIMCVCVVEGRIVWKHTFVKRNIVCDPQPPTRCTSPKNIDRLRSIRMPPGLGLGERPLGAHIGFKYEPSFLLTLNQRSCSALALADLPSRSHSCHLYANESF